MASNAMHSDELAKALASGYEEAVEVNQRGLVEKLLARYSGEHTVFRELAQNADDALANSIEIHFDTEREVPLGSLRTEPIQRITIKNDGIVFREEDWRRLKTIADGQPNEESIGAFGVGFYSIWSLSDQPLVVSGSEAMEFRWRGQQLVVRRAKNPSQEGELAPNGRPWSSITMPCRDREPMPDPASFSKFLSTALPFTQNIRSMSVFFNKHQLLALDKLPAPPRTLAIPQYTSIRSPQRLMSITAVESTPVQMTCKVMRIAVTSPGQPSAKKASAQPAKQSFATKFLSFASAQRQPETEVKEVVPAKDPAEVLSSALFLSIVTASTLISAPADFIAEFSRSTKKAPPAQTRLKILFTSKDEVDASSLDKSSKDAQSIFSGLISGSGQQGRIYIGFPLFQTTGMECAVSAKLIPTVEREQIDLNSRALADYNRELLALAGITSRIVYDSEMGEIMSKLIKLGSAGEGAAEDPARTWLLQQASHLMKSFTYHDSTPIGSISRLIQTSFFSCNTREFLVASSRGILPSTKVRLPATELTFLAGLAVIPDDIAKENTLLLDHLQQRDLISSVTIDDVVKQLNEKALTTTQAISAIQWWIGLSHNSLYDSSLLNSFRNALIMSIAADDDAGVEKVVPLSSIKYFLNPRTIPPDMPLPPSVLPHQVARATSQTDLQRTFAFVELSMAEWTRYIVSKEMLGGVDTSITLSAVFAERFLNVLAKVWPNLRPAESSQIVSLLEPIACIPTKKGMHKPAESYLPKVDLFEDLPVTTLAVKGNLERLLKSLGVRTHVGLQLVFSRLLGGGEWDQEQVAKYLVSVNNSLTSDEKDRLGKTAWLTIESKTDLGEGQKPTRYKARTVYEPNDSLRELGLPIIAWKGNWRRHSEEAKLLYSMGLQKGPAVEAILAFAADMSDTERQKKALAYFLSNYDQQYATSYQPSKQNFPFVPVLHGGNATFAKPQEAYTSVGSQVLGFPMLHPDYQLQAAKFKLAADPSAKALVGALLAKPPATLQMATPIFAYLATQAARAWTRMRPLVKLTVAMLTSTQAGFSAAEHNDLAFQRFIPAQAEEDGPFNLYSPKSVFFQSAESALATEFRSLFVFVNYGTAANAFLLQVGVRAEPTITEITALLLADPKRFLTLAGSSDKYISLLRQIASSYSALPVATKKRMLSAPFILGYERLHTDSSADKKGKQTDADDDEDDDVLLSYRLALPGEVVVIDDTTFLADFRDNLLTCPQDDLVEAFCEQLGSKRISKLVSVNYSSTTVPENASPRAASIRKLVLERVTLFLHERQQSSSGKDIRYSDDWLKNNLQVREVTRIERQRTLTLGQSRFVKTSVASAAATIEKGKGALLRISSNLNDLDYYEVAAALTPIVLSKQRIHDSLLLMTLLQTSLRDLKRRGFNVDKIMSQRKAEQDAIERQQREERAAGDLKRIKEQELQKALPPAYGDDDGRFSMDEKRSLVGDGSSPPPPQPARSLFDNLRSKLKGNDPLVPPKSPHMAIESAAGESSGGPPRDRAIAGRGPQEPQGPQVTPTSSIATNVLRAVQASRPDRSGNITADVNTEDVKESNSNYCDSAPANNLDFVTEIASVRFYISRDIDADENILQKHSMALRRFVQDIVLPVGAVYNVEPKALHVFYDGSGPLIAFNRSGSLFFNLRFHLAWYGEQVKGGFLSDALISTYFSMAHELAHNLVLPHNAEHAFYTSAIAQQYFLPLAGYIAELDSNRSAPLQLTQH